MDSITDVPGIYLGQAQDRKGLTGCTVILTREEGATAGVDIRGGAPGTRETALLRPEMLVERVHGIVLTGGSAFGLDAASGVMKYLKEHGVGFETGYLRIPILPGAVLFDLNIGAPIWPDMAMGYRAAASASNAPVVMGNAGAGTGATVGKILGPDMMMKGGLGSASFSQEGGITMGALAVVNALGDIRDEKGEPLAGLYHQEEGRFLNTEEVLSSKQPPGVFGNTTLGVLATDACLTPAAAEKVASMGQDGLARAIYPCHTMMDGDIVFALSTGEKEGDISFLGALGARLLRTAIYRGIKAAASVVGAVSWQELNTEKEDH